MQVVLQPALGVRWREHVEARFEARDHEVLADLEVLHHRVARHELLQRAVHEPARDQREPVRVPQEREALLESRRCSGSA